MNQRIHVIPMGQSEPLHSVSMQCKCHPLPQENGRLAIHNAFDGREAQERQGIHDIKRPWCLVYEDISVDAKSATTGNEARELYEYLIREFVRFGAPSTTLSKVEKLFHLATA